MAKLFYVYKLMEWTSSINGCRSFVLPDGTNKISFCEQTKGKFEIGLNEILDYKTPDGDYEWKLDFAFLAHDKQLADEDSMMPTVPIKVSFVGDLKDGDDFRQVITVGGQIDSQPQKCFGEFTFHAYANTNADDNLQLEPISVVTFTSDDNDPSCQHMELVSSCSSNSFYVLELIPHKELDVILYEECIDESRNTTASALSGLANATVWPLFSFVKKIINVSTDEPSLKLVPPGEKDIPSEKVKRFRTLHPMEEDRVDTKLQSLPSSYWPGLCFISSKITDDILRSVTGTRTLVRLDHDNDPEWKWKKYFKALRYSARIDQQSPPSSNIRNIQFQMEEHSYTCVIFPSEGPSIRNVRRAFLISGAYRRKIKLEPQKNEFGSTIWVAKYVAS